MRYSRVVVIKKRLQWELNLRLPEKLRDALPVKLCSHVVIQQESGLVEIGVKQCPIDIFKKKER